MLRYEVIMKSNTDYRVYDNEARKWVTFQTVDGKKTHTFLSLSEAIENAEKLPSNADIL